MAEQMNSGSIGPSATGPGNPAGGYSTYGTGTQSHLLDYVRTAYKHRRIALTTLAVVFLGAVVYTFSATPIYAGRVQLLLEPENQNVVSFKQVIEQDKATNEYYQTQYTILRSRVLARRTIDALGLWNNPEFGGGHALRDKPSGVAAAVTGTMAWVRGLFSSAPEAVGVPGANETEVQSRVIDAYLSRLTVSPVRHSRLVDVKFASPSPDLAARIANTLATEYIAQNLEYKFLSTKEASDWLGGQLAVERKKLEASELALQRYRETGDAVALEDRQNIVVQRLADLNAAYTSARTTRFEKEALYNQLRSLQNDRAALDTFPAIMSNTFVQQLKGQLADLQRQQAQMTERLGDKHPDMIKLTSAIQSTQAKLDGEIAKVVQSVHNEYLSALAQERSLAGALESQKADALSLNRKGIEYGVLRRETESNRQMYEALMQRSKETGISGELKTSNIRVVDRAEVPRSPVRPDKPTNLLVGLLGGLMAGIGLAFFVEYLDHRIKNPDEIRRYLGLTFLGLVPGVSSRKREGGGSPMLTREALLSFSEAFRGIRTNVAFSMAEQGTRSVLVTSSQPGEGKSVVANNLATSVAQTGRRVLLVDADMRKPRQHELFGITQDPGLSSLLASQVNWGDAVRKVNTPNLWVLPAGPNPPNPAELLDSTRCKELLTELGSHFDWLVIDSPPVMAVTDASVIAHLTTGVVFVIGSEQTHRRMVQAAVDQLRGAKATILGAVLNRADVERNPYYYSHYYRREYAGYYSSEKLT